MHADIAKSVQGELRETKSQICNKVPVTCCKSWTYNQPVSWITTTETQHQGMQKWKTRKMLPGALALNPAFFVISSMTLNNVIIFLPLVLLGLFFGGVGRAVGFFGLFLLVTRWGQEYRFVNCFANHWYPVLSGTEIFKMFNLWGFENYLCGMPCHFSSFLVHLPSLYCTFLKQVE